MLFSTYAVSLLPSAVLPKGEAAPLCRRRRPPLFLARCYSFCISASLSLARRRHDSPQPPSACMRRSRPRLPPRRRAADSRSPRAVSTRRRIFCCSRHLFSVQYVRGLHTAAADASDADGLYRCMQQIDHLRTSTLLAGDPSAGGDVLTGEELRARVRAAVADAFLAPGGMRGRLVGALDAILSDMQDRFPGIEAEAIRRGNAHAARVAESGRLRDDVRHAEAALASARAELTASETALVAMSELCHYSAAARQLVESKDLSGVLRLAAAADYLDLRPLMDLCSVPVAAFCAGDRSTANLRDDLLHALGARIPKKRKRQPLAALRLALNGTRASASSSTQRFQPSKQPAARSPSTQTSTGDCVRLPTTSCTAWSRGASQRRRSEWHLHSSGGTLRRGTLPSVRARFDTQLPRRIAGSTPPLSSLLI